MPTWVSASKPNATANSSPSAAATPLALMASCKQIGALHVNRHAIGATIASAERTSIIILTMTTAQTQESTPSYLRLHVKGVAPRASVSTFACKDLLLRTCECLGVTPSHLSRLLGMRQPAPMYDWLAGGRRPDQVYTSRLARLLVLQIQGEFSHEWYAFSWQTMKPISQQEFFRAREVFYETLEGARTHSGRSVQTPMGQSRGVGLPGGEQGVFPRPRTAVLERPD